MCSVEFYLPEYICNLQFFMFVDGDQLLKIYIRDIKRIYFGWSMWEKLGALFFS